MNQENRKPNHLIHEKSPYLLQHAYNPVNWYPWSEEAFAKAKKEDKPIFLSIGYSTCHWCHVMERESFEDEEVAELLNDNFIAIKVDKEERPDVDSIYMTVCQAVTGSGGWPLTIIMTPEQKPFFAGTYLPKNNRGQMMGLMNLLTAISRMWDADREQLNKSGNEVTELLKNQYAHEEEDQQPTQKLVKIAAGIYKRGFDPTYGGFHLAPKFPTPHNLMFLLRYAVLEHDKEALQMVEKTLDAMFRGGIYDHIGGGFSRYSTDNKWLVPHFEKMLYDNALLVIAYTEAYQETKREMYELVVRETLSYIMREMTDEAGGFYCAQDADSEGVEGKYYVFTPDEIIKVLGEEEGKEFNAYYDITKEGNFEGKSILNLIGREKVILGEEHFSRLRKKVYDYRLTKTTLHKDDKILTSWNALMIVAFAKAYQVFGEKEYLEAAKKAVQFIKEKLKSPSGRLLVRYRDGHAAGLGNIDDYAFLAYAYITLYEATWDVSYLVDADTTAKEMIRLFWDTENGGFYLYGEDAEQLIARPKEVYDGAIPSGNSVAGYVLLKLEHLTEQDEYRTVAERQLAFLCGKISEYPAGYSFSLCAFMLKLWPTKELVCVTKATDTKETLREQLQHLFLPNLAVLVKEEGSEPSLDTVVPFIKEYKEKDNQTTFYLCENRSCKAPVCDFDVIKEMLL